MPYIILLLYTHHTHTLYTYLIYAHCIAYTKMQCNDQYLVIAPVVIPKNEKCEKYVLKLLNKVIEENS